MPTPVEEGRIPGWIWLALIMGLAIGLRVAGLNQHSCWFDETVTMRLARQANPAALRQTMEQIDATRAPLHPLLLQGWLALFGPSDLAGRALSALFGSIAVLLVFWVGRTAFDARTALWASGLMAISPLQVEYAQEVRMYAWLVVITLICWGLLISFRRSAPLVRQVAYAGALVALVYSHPLGGLMIMALALGYGVMIRESQLTWRSWALIHVALVVAFAPWLGQYLDHPPDLKYPRFFEAWTWPKAFIGFNDLAVWGCYLLVVVGALTIERDTDWSGARRFVAVQVRSRDLTMTLVCLIWFLVPPLLIHLYSVLRHPISGPIRYVLYVGPAFLLLVAHGLARLPGRLRLAVTVLVVALAIRPLADRVYDPDTKPNWRLAAATVHRVAPQASVILFCSNGHFYLPTLQYYLDPGTRLAAVYSYASPTLPVPEPTVWYVEDRVDGIHQTPPLLDQLYEPVQTWRFGRLTLSYNRLRELRVAQQTAPVDHIRR